MKPALLALVATLAAGCTTTDARGYRTDWYQRVLDRLDCPTTCWCPTTREEGRACQERKAGMYR